MPRITEARRAARRAELVAAAVRCFARDGFHQTSMAGIAAEAGLSTGASYRYFASKEDLVLEIAGQAFETLFAPVGDLLEQAAPPTAADLATSSVRAGTGGDELLRCVVQTWAELLRHDEMRARAAAGFDGVRARIATALRRGQRAGTVPAELDPDDGARVVMAVLHGFVLQRVAFGLDETAGFQKALRALLR